MLPLKRNGQKYEELLVKINELGSVTSIAWIFCTCIDVLEGGAVCELDGEAMLLEHPIKENMVNGKMK